MRPRCRGASTMVMTSSTTRTWTGTCRSDDSPPNPERRAQTRASSRHRTAPHAAVLLVSALTWTTLTVAPVAAATSNPLLSDAALRGYQQPSVAVNAQDANHVAVAFMDGNERQVCALALSSDGGRTWTRRLVVAPGGLHPEFNSSSDFPWCWNPVIAYGPDGTLYYVYQESREPNPYSRLRIAVSHDNGASFDPPRLIDSAAPAQPRYGFDDWWPDVSVDQQSGRVVVVWDRYPGYPQPPYEIAAAMSTDHGRTFTTPVQLNPRSELETVAPSETVDSTGTVHATWVDITTFAGGTDIATGCNPPPDGQYEGCLAPVAIDAATLSPAGPLHTTNVTEVDATVDMGCPGADWISEHLQTRFPHLCDPFHYLGPEPRVAAGPLSGELALTWYEGSPQGPNRIHYTTSRDDGRTWSPQQIVGMPGRSGDQQILPWLSVSPGGRLDLVYYELGPVQYRTTELGLVPTGIYDVESISSNDWGRSFGAPVRLDDQPSDLEIGPTGFDDWPTYGMRLGAASLPDRVFAAWTDTRRGTAINAKQDIAFGITQATEVAGPARGNGSVLLVVAVAGSALLLAAIAAGSIARRRGRKTERRESAARR